MRLNKGTILLLILGIMVVIPAEGQRRRRRFDFMQGTKLTPMAGVNVFYGDLVDKSRTSYSFGASFEREMNQIINARGHLTLGEMKGKQTLPNNNDLVYAYFKTPYVELGFGATARLMDWAFGYYKQRSFNPYAIGQIGINYFNAKEWYGNNSGVYPSWHALAGQAKENTLWHSANTITPIVSLGGGLSYWVSPRISVRGELLANLPFTDMMDGHKEWDDDYGVIHKTDGPVDFYYTATVGLAITLKDSKWRNEPKYNRKAYVKMRRYNMGGSSSRTKFKPQKRRR